MKHVARTLFFGLVALSVLGQTLNEFSARYCCHLSKAELIELSGNHNDCPRSDLFPFNRVNKCLKCPKGTCRFTKKDTNSDCFCPSYFNKTTLLHPDCKEDFLLPYPESVGKDNQILKSCAVNDAAAPCVETAWLKKNDLIHAAIRHAGVARVLCIPGLPCGTAGHLLRRRNGALVSFREVCETRSDCVESTAAVSQLSHMYDWSRYSAGALQLTSLSAHPESHARSVSRVIASLADTLNKNGLGWVCNMVAVLPLHVSNTFNKVMVSFESN